MSDQLLRRSLVCVLLEYVCDFLLAAGMVTQLISLVRAQATEVSSLAIELQSLGDIRVLLDQLTDDITRLSLTQRRVLLDRKRVFDCVWKIQRVRLTHGPFVSFPL
jgi:hypothetical protein